MKNRKYTIVYFLILTFTGLLLTQCKSVEFTFLGFFKKEYSKGIEKPKSEVSNLPDSNLPNNTSIRILGVVKDTINSPIKEADIYVYKNDQIISYANCDVTGRFSLTIQPIPLDIVSQASAKTTVAGTDTITNMEIDSIHSTGYKILVSANAYNGVERNIVIHPNDSIQLNFVLKKLCSVSGMVTMSDKTPVSGAIILFKNKEGKLSTTQTNSKGEFFVDQLKDGVYTISVSHNKYAFSTQTVELLKGFDKEGIVLVAGEGEISGVIKAASNTPVRKAIITVQKMDIQDYMSGQPFQITDTIENRESYKIAGLSSGQYKIQVDSPGYGSVIKETELRENSLQSKENFALVPEGVISGKLINYNAKDQAFFMVIDNEKNSYVPGDIEIEDDGKYILKGIASGNYTIVLKWKSMLLSKQSIDIKAGKETSNIDFVLKEATGSISGRITSGINNEPIENAMIIASSESSRNYAISDTNGEYKIYGLASDIYLVIANALTHKTDCKSGLLLENNENMGNVDFNLTLENK